jgi:hypothetical protein
MTIPGLLQLLLTIGFGIYTFIKYAENPIELQGRWGCLPILAIAVLLSLSGLIIILWGHSEEWDAILLFRAKDIYIGTPSLACGMGIFMGSLCSQLVLSIRRFYKCT